MRYFFNRLLLGFQLLPVRLKRFFVHLGRWCPWRGSWWAECFFLLADVLLVPDVYEAFSNTLAARTRSLTQPERRLLASIYGPSLPYSMIRIDEHARIGPPQGAFCYVSFHTINSWGPMPPDTLVHEAMHVWQYRRVGAVYIPRALAAQRTEMGYNYGGPDKLGAFPELGFFNYEQQADIIADAFRLREGGDPRWSPGHTEFELFLPFLAELRREETS